MPLLQYGINPNPMQRTEEALTTRVRLGTSVMLLVLNPVFDEMEHLEILAQEIVPKL
jgi:hypothetical protein